MNQAAGARYISLRSGAVVIAALALPMVLVAAGACQTVSHVYSFTNQNSSQFPPHVTPVQGRDGELYGTTDGGTNGSIFKISVSRSFSELFAFHFTDGCCPAYGLTLATDGNLYGAVPGGGNGQNGVLFKITPTGAYTVLHYFAGGADGAGPDLPPIQASDGSLYGNAFGDNSGSTLYKYSLASGGFSTIYQFAGQFVDPRIIQGADGNLYGAGAGGGTKGCGSLFKMSTAGVLLQSYSFPCGKGGNGPEAILQATDGNFYGTTGQGGSYNAGTIFKMTPDFQVSILYSFMGPLFHDGRFPAAGLVQATDGNLYGTTSEGGDGSNMGTLFQVSTSGVYKLLYSFRGKSGKLPGGGLVQHTSGLLFGTAEQGGANGLGTVFALDMGLGPFVTFVQPTGKVGQTAQILGQGFTGTTSVTFNGVPATSFTVGSGTYLRAVIPTGATTGPVVVTTPTGTLTSNVSFAVVQ